MLQYLAYLKDYRILRKQSSAKSSPIPFGKPYPCLKDKKAPSGTASGHYFHQDLLVAQRIFENKPQTHMDIGSRIDGFIAHVASFRKIEVLDVRPLSIDHPNIQFRQADLMHPVPELTACCDSVSCLHALEHFGLGRYGDPLDIEGHRKGFMAITRLLKPGGVFYFSVPIGPLRIEFNAHRVFSLPYLLDLVSPLYRIVHFSYVDDAGNLHRDVPLEEVGVADNYGCTYGCGIFEMIRLP
ncbi:DUF268 domain-containing protein [Desulfobotulus sp.]|uniref:DUF268 domain-containing protein n=1 Tax=Desulfobotulus sp. TaxID=1940337 RepID=UPI002A368711|nr:DUF268 domain-containing protein [Desulfobotulus sp.]MDY0162970.1 DUF268 domain-containing protein [Desulfobotulus sp.]